MKNALTAEFIGTFFLYLTIGMCVTEPGAGAFTPIAVGVGLAALVYACGHLSKAHFNPATTAAYATAGTHKIESFMPFVLAIFGGAIAAALCVAYLNPQGVANAKMLDVNYGRAAAAEFLFTFALMWVILNVAIAKGTAKNGFYGIAIGGIVAAGAYAVGAISFAAFNPAVTLALCINGLLPWSALPLYWFAQITAALAAALLFNRLNTTNPSERNGAPWN